MDSTKEKKFISSNNKKRLLFLVNIVLMVALIVVASYAWFNRNTINTVDVDQIAFEGSSDLEVSLTGDDTDYGFSKTMSITTNSLSNEITGDGIPANFRHAVTTSSASNSTILVPDTAQLSKWENAVSGKDYIVQNVYFRSKEQISVYLGSGSYVKGADEINGNSLVGSAQRLSSAKGIVDSSGNPVSVSKDCVVGATRVAFLNSAGTTRSFTWIPRANIFYDTKGENKIIYGGTAYDSDNLTDSYANNPMCPLTSTHYYYTTTGTAATSANVIAGAKALSSGSAVAGSKVVELTTLDGEYYKGSAQIVIWIEGCDAEARRAFAGGKFGIHFQFIGFTS